MENASYSKNKAAEANSDLDADETQTADSVPAELFALRELNSSFYERNAAIRSSTDRIDGEVDPDRGAHTEIRKLREVQAKLRAEISTLSVDCFTQKEIIAKNRAKISELQQAITRKDAEIKHLDKEFRREHQSLSSEKAQEVLALRETEIKLRGQLQTQQQSERLKVAELQEKLTVTQVALERQSETLREKIQESERLLAVEREDFQDKISVAESTLKHKEETFQKKIDEQNTILQKAKDDYRRDMARLTDTIWAKDLEIKSLQEIESKLSAQVGSLNGENVAFSKHSKENAEALKVLQAAHSERLAELVTLRRSRKDHAETRESLKKALEFVSSLQASVAKLENEGYEKQVLLERQRADLKEEFAKQMAAKNQEFSHYKESNEEKINDISRSFTQEVETFRSAREQLVAQIAGLKAEYAACVQEHQRTVEAFNETKNDLRQKIEQARAERVQEVSGLKNTFGLQISQLQTENEAKVASLIVERKSDIKALQAEQAAKIASLMQQQEAQISTLRFEREAQVTNLKATHDAEIARIQGDRENQVKGLRTEHEQAIVVLQRASQARLVELNADHHKDLLKLQNEHQGQMTAVQAKHASEIEALRQQNLAQLANISAERDNLNLNMQLASERLIRLHAERETEVSTLQREREAQLQSVEARHAIDLAKAREEHDKELRAFGQKFDQQFEELSVERKKHGQRDFEFKALQAEHEAQMQIFQAKRQAQIAQIRREQEQELDALAKVHEAQFIALNEEKDAQYRSAQAESELALATLQSEFDHEIGVLKSECQAQVSALQVQLETLDRSLRADHEKEIAHIQAESEARTKEMQAQFEEKVHRMQVELQSQTSRTQSSETTHRAQQSKLDQALNEIKNLKASNAAMTSDIEQAKHEVAKLQEDRRKFENDLNEELHSKIANAEAENKRLKTWAEQIGAREQQLRVYVSSLNSEKADLLRFSKHVASEIQVVAATHPIKDYLAATEYELSKAELSLKTMPALATERVPLASAVRQLMEQRDFLKSLLTNAQRQLEQKVVKLNKIISTGRLGPVPPPPPKVEVGALTSVSQAGAKTSVTTVTDVEVFGGATPETASAIQPEVMWEIPVRDLE